MGNMRVTLASDRVRSHGVLFGLAFAVGLLASGSARAVTMEEADQTDKIADSYLALIKKIDCRNPDKAAYEKALADLDQTIERQLKEGAVAAERQAIPTLYGARATVNEARDLLARSCPTLYFPAVGPRPVTRQSTTPGGQVTLSAGVAHIESNTTATVGVGALYTWNTVNITMPSATRTMHAPGPALDFTGQIATPIGIRFYGDFLFGAVQGGDFTEISGSTPMSGGVTGTFGALTVGASYDLVRTPRYYAGPYVGWYYDEQALYGMTDSAPTTQFPLFHPEWKSSLVGLAGQFQVTDRIAVSGIVAGMPTVYATWGPFQGHGTGWYATGTASYQMTPQLALDLQFKWRTESVSGDVGASAVHIDASMDSVGVGFGLRARW
jgi:hypothetical protein